MVRQKYIKNLLLLFLYILCFYLDDRNSETATSKSICSSQLLSEGRSSSKEEFSFDDYVIRSLERLHQKIDLQGEMLVNALKGFSMQGRPAVKKSLFSFPLGSKEDVDNLELMIKDLEIREQLVILFFYFDI